MTAIAFPALPGSARFQVSIFPLAWPRRLRRSAAAAIGSHREIAAEAMVAAARSAFAPVDIRLEAGQARCIAAAGAQAFLD
jgi:hypothetical protein